MRSNLRIEDIAAVRVLSPQGKEIEVNDLGAFARKYRMNARDFWMEVIVRRGVYRGWRCVGCYAVNTPVVTQFTRFAH